MDLGLRSSARMNFGYLLQVLEQAVVTLLLDLNQLTISDSHV